ncbi:hypothetical protein [Streptomyces roseolilacinus]|uniref:Uncharacterized protein n=1 Tax=Streptomyces roseolilacinus TaxID=66904 RepID=A0A918AX57_9ACTN|nr:hypothetical protein [Streptomyces roseolilacinus]GGP95788.1 hypothetical protein GCM10010249_12340 [Streptomyces roseolilacinus]
MSAARGARRLVGRAGPGDAPAADDDAAVYGGGELRVAADPEGRAAVSLA